MLTSTQDACGHGCPGLFSFMCRPLDPLAGSELGRVFGEIDRVTCGCFLVLGEAGQEGTQKHDEDEAYEQSP